MPSYKLKYFDLRVKGELPRWIMSAAGQSWEDVRLTPEQWAELKPKTPFGGLPLLEVEGVVLCQSNSIARFLAKRLGFAGKTDLEEAQASMVVDCVEEIVPKLINAFFTARFANDAKLLLTWADMSAAHWLASFGDISKYPKLVALKARVEKQPGIAAWRAKRPAPVALYAGSDF